MDVIDKIEVVAREGETPITRIDVSRARVVPVN
jgi:hypothetical protein